MAIADFNGDGLPDLAVTTASSIHPGYPQDTVSVLLNDPAHPGQFLPATAYAVGYSPTSVAVGDFNGDGILDLVVANSNGLPESPAERRARFINGYSTGLSILFGDPSHPGQFLPQIQVDIGEFANSVTVADFNHDGVLDLAVASTFFLNNVGVAFGNPASPGTFLPAQFFPNGPGPSGNSTGPVFVAAGDVNGDSLPDLITANRGVTPAMSVFLGSQTAAAQLQNVSPGAPAQYALTAGYSGNSGFAASAIPQPLPVVVPHPTSTVLTANPTTGALGTVFTLTATVAISGKPVTAGERPYSYPERVSWEFLQYALACMPCERRVSSLVYIPNAAIMKTDNVPVRRRKNRTQLIQHFSELNLCSALRNNLDKNEFVTPTPVQAQSIPPLMEGRDVVATAQTGTGKTLAFSIPVIEALAAVPRTKTIKVLILSPTRELAIQIDAAFRQLAHGMRIRTAVVVGGMSETKQLRDIQAGAEVVIATPGRLCDYLERQLIDLSGAATVVLDEADRMLDMGFLPALRIILDKLPAKRHSMLFSATMEQSVAGLAASYVHNPVRIAVEVCAQTAGRIDLFCYEVPQGSKFDLLEHLLKNEKGSFLIFVATKEGAGRLAKFLERGRHRVASIHGDRSQSQRNEALQGFKDGVYRALVATDVAARGIHVDDIAHVVNYDLPQEAGNFIHRVGRTGRAGARGASWTFVTPLERSDVRNYERTLGIQVQYRELPSLPRPIGLVTDVEAYLASMSASQPSGSGPKPTTTRSFSGSRRRSMNLLSRSP